MAKRADPAESFSSRALFERAAEPVFVLNRRRRLRYANPAFEKLARRPLADLYNLPCVRDRRADPLGQALCPPPEVLAGAPGAVRRPAPPARVGPPWWDVSYLPLAGADGLLAVIGRVAVVGAAAAAKGRAVPDALLQLRRRLALRYSFASLAADTPAAARAAAQARVAARNTAPVVLVGEPGTGKQWFARVIHHQGATAERTFLPVDCAGLPPAALEELLFGEPGLAHPERVGTVFLRGPAALPRDLQARLADWLRGEHDDAPRFVAACPREPSEEVAAGRLLDELRLVLDIQTIHLVPLRERPADLPRLAALTLERLGAGGRELSPAALELLAAHPWPGNLRELDEVLRAAVAAAPEGPIEPAHLPALAREHSPLPAAGPKAVFPLKETLRQVQRRLILVALRRARGQKAEAARLLDISRSELWRRMGELGVGEDDWRGSVPEAGGDATLEDRGP